MDNEDVGSHGLHKELSGLSTEIQVSHSGDAQEEGEGNVVLDSLDNLADRISRGNTRLALHTETHYESDLLAACEIAQSLPSHAFSLSTAHAPALESFLESLHSALCEHAKTTPDPALQYATSISRLSLVLRPAELDTRLEFLNARALTLHDWFHKCSDEKSTTGLEVLMEAVVLRRRLVAMTTSDDQKREQRSSLASLLWCYWKCNGESDLDVLQEEIDLRREILQAQGVYDPERVTACESLATSVYTLYKSSGDLMILNEALDLQREALRLRPKGHPYRAASCANLATLLWTRFDQTRDTLLLDEALELQREALRLMPVGHPDRAIMCGALANSLHTHLNQTGDMLLLDEALELQREALRLRPERHPDRAALCAIRAALLRTRFDQTGATLLLDEALELGREALRLTPEGHPNRAALCANLATSLWTRFNQTWDTLLLGEALELQREALRLTPEGHPDRAALCANLAASLWTRFHQTGDTLLLDEALELEREALRLRPEGHPDRALSCGNLANAMRTCFNQTGDTLLLDEALELYREALRLWPEGHPDRALLCGNLANALRTCFDQTGDTLLLDEARFLCTLTTKESVVSSSNHVYLRVQLSRIYTLPAYSSYSPTVAVSLLIEVLHHRVGLIRHFYDINDALRKCAKAALSHEDNERLLTIYRVMIEVLPELGTAVLDQTSRLERWRDAGSLPLEAFLHALKANDIPLGLQLLEQGRAVLWSQTLAMRDPQIEKLPDAWKHQLKTLLRSMSSSTDRIDVPRTDLTARDWAHTSYTRLQQLLKEIRASPGLERFMRGPSYPELVHAATVHPVVLLAIMEDTACHAVVISSASALPVHLILDSITASELGKLGDDMRGLDLNVRAVCGLTAATGERGMNSTGGREDPAVRKLHQALKRLWIGIVKPIFDCLGLEKASGRYRRRIHWCPIGTLVFLPIHAAGVYSGGRLQEGCSDYVVSSYTPTLSALHRARTNLAPITRDRSLMLLAAGASETVPSLKMPFLYNVQAEVTDVARMARATDQIQVIEYGRTSAAKIHEVVDALPRADVVHLACHGVQDLEDPLKSGFCLGDGKLSVSELMGIKLEHPFLAFLSACETAKGDRNQPDQVIHLAAAMLFCGFPNVVATMWSISDADGPAVARAFYEALLAEQVIDADAVAYALDAAVCKLRENGVSPSRWASFIHVGA